MDLIKVKIEIKKNIDKIITGWISSLKGFPTMDCWHVKIKIMRLNKKSSNLEKNFILFPFMILFLQAKNFKFSN